MLAFNSKGSRELNKLMAINNAIMSGRQGTARGVDSDGDVYAEFTAYYYGKEYTYRVYTNGCVFRKPFGVVDSEVFDSVSVGGCKNGTYPEILIDSVPVKLYNLIHACFEPNFVDWFTRGARKVVNHTVVTRSFDGTLKPDPRVWADLHYTEVVSISDNNKHGRFINNLGLVDVYVSAYDVDALTKVLEDCAKRIGVSSMYDIPYSTMCDEVIAYYENERKIRPIPAIVDFR